MRYRIKPSNLAGVVGAQVGKIKADARGRILDEVSSITTQFSNQCPPPNELIRIVNTLNLISRNTANLRGRIKPFERMVSRLETTLRVAINVISVLKAVPILTTVGGPGLVGVIFSLPIAITNKYADLLRLASELAASIEDDIDACKAILGSVDSDLVNLKSRLDSLSPSIEECSKNGGFTEEQLKLIKEATEGANKEGTAGTNTDVSFRSVNGKDYVLSVQTDPNSPSIAPKRFAVAKDQIGVVVLRGPSSFASSTDVLIQELKFRIDNQLP